MTTPTSPSLVLTRRRFAPAGLSARAGAALVPPPRSGAQPAPASAGPADATLVEDLVAANRILVDQGVLDGYGHVSARHDRDPGRYLMSRSLAPQLVTAGDILGYDLDSVAVDPRGRTLYLERFIQGEIYRARPDVKAIVHSHSPSVIPFGVSAVPLQPLGHMSAFLGTRVPIFDIRDATGGMTDMLIRTPALGQALARTLGPGVGALLRGHGAVVVGPTMPHAVFRSVYLEMNARLQGQAMALGGPVKYLDPEAARLADITNQGTYGRPWELWKRKVLSR